MGIGDLNQKLKQTYEHYWSEIDATIPKRRGYSYPLLMDVNRGYELSRIKLMVVGQQAFNWGGKEYGDYGRRPLDEPISELMELYRQFNRGENYTSTPFWIAS